jgi:16S rRNA (adenine1518-N6/adenine1519-N6)-dimethyltransferase
VLLSRLENPPVAMTVLLQEELAQRIAARPGDREWGPLSARLRLTYEARAGRRVGAQLFWPRPRVASRVLSLERISAPPPTSGELSAFDELVDTVFQQRRKSLAASLGVALGSRTSALALLGALGIAPDARPEGLAPEMLREMARHSLWHSRGVGGRARSGLHRRSRGEETRPEA